MTTVEFNSNKPIKIDDLKFVSFGEVLSLIQNGYKIENIENILNINVNQTVKQKPTEVETKDVEKTTKAEPKRQKKNHKTVTKPKNIETKPQPKELKNNKKKTFNIF